MSTMISWKQRLAAAVAVAVLSGTVAHAGEIHFAAIEGNLLKMDALLRAHPDQLESADETGATPLILAATNAKKPMVEYLLARGAKIEAKNANGETALHVAVSRGYLDIITLLLTKGANVNARPKAAETPLHLAVDLGYVKTVDLLLDFHADVNASNNVGFTSLQYAVHRNYDDIVETLISNKADVNAYADVAIWAAVRNPQNVQQMRRSFRPPFRCTPLALAEYYNHPEIAEILKKHGAER